MIYFCLLWSIFSKDISITIYNLKNLLQKMVLAKHYTNIGRGNNVIFDMLIHHSFNLKQLESWVFSFTIDLFHTSFFSWYVPKYLIFRASFLCKNRVMQVKPSPQDRIDVRTVFKPDSNQSLLISTSTWSKSLFYQGYHNT